MAEISVNIDDLFVAAFLGKNQQHNRRQAHFYFTVGWGALFLL